MDTPNNEIKTKRNIFLSHADVEESCYLNAELIFA